MGASEAKIPLPSGGTPAATIARVGEHIAKNEARLSA